MNNINIKKANLVEFKEKLESMDNIYLEIGLNMAEEILSEIYNQKPYQNKFDKLELAKAIYSIRKARITNK